MWEIALLSLGCIPLMALATSLELNKVLGEDEGKQLLLFGLSDALFHFLLLQH
jgi:hypothetical protein